MLYLIGGAPRAGKSILARRLLTMRKVPYFPTDLLMMGLAKSMALPGLNPHHSAQTRSPMMWPILRGIATTIVENGDDYLLEGDVLMPENAAELRNRFGAAVRACFLGYENVDPARKMRDIRRHDADRSEWTYDCDDAHLMRLIGEFKTLSEELRRECADYDLRYFDGSEDLLATVEAAVAYLGS